jgi:tetrahydromethanopterin S-methyltransferase subunit G
MVPSMAVMAREEWTDGRLDDLQENVNQRFDEVDKRFDRIERRFDSIDARFDSLQRTIVVCFGGLTSTVVGVLLVSTL